MIVKDRNFEEFISAEKIRQVVADLTAKVEKDYEGKEPFFLVMMNGAFIFASDFLRNLKNPVKIGCVKYTSYEGMNSTGKVTPVLPIPASVKGKDVILLEDIVDTGRTMACFLEELKTFEPKSIAIVSLFCKPEVFQGKFKIDYVGMNIPNKFIVGYGLDYDGEGRNLPAIYYTE